MAYQAVTLDDLLILLAARTEQQPFWTADQARRAINEGLRIFNLITGIFRTASTQPLIPDDNYLYVGGTLIKGTRVTMSGRPLVLTSINALDKLVRGWPNVNTASGGVVPPEVVWWAPVGLTEILVYPKEAPPGQSLITIDGVRSTPILRTGGDYLNLGREEINSLLGYALHVLSLAKGIEALTNTRPLYVEFLKAAAKQNAIFGASSLYRKLIGLDRTRTEGPMRDAQTQATGEAYADSKGSKGGPG